MALYQVSHFTYLLTYLEMCLVVQLGFECVLEYVSETDDDDEKILGVTFDPKLKFGEHIKKTKEKASKTINIIKNLTSTKWRKQKETLTNTYKTITRPILEYGSTIWSPLISDTNLNKLQIIQNLALGIATGCTRDTSTQHLHDETKVLPLNERLKLHASQLRLKKHVTQHPLFQLNKTNPKSRHIRETIFDNKEYTLNSDAESKVNSYEDVKHYKVKHHLKLVDNYLDNRAPNKILQNIASDFTW